MNKLQYKKTYIRASNKKKIIKELFNDVSDKYNLMNDILSFGLHRLWKRDMIDCIKHDEPKVILDLAGGTGDISKLLSNVYKHSRILTYDIFILKSH